MHLCNLWRASRIWSQVRGQCVELEAPSRWRCSRRCARAARPQPRLLRRDSDSESVARPPAARVLSASSFRFVCSRSRVAQQTNFFLFTFREQTNVLCLFPFPRRTICMCASILASSSSSWLSSWMHQQITSSALEAVRWRSSWSTLHSAWRQREQLAAASIRMLEPRDRLFSINLARAAALLLRFACVRRCTSVPLVVRLVLRV